MTFLNLCPLDEKVKKLIRFYSKSVPSFKLSLQKLVIEMKTKKQTETNENQSIITNSLSGKYIFAPTILIDSN